MEQAVPERGLQRWVCFVCIRVSGPRGRGCYVVTRPRWVLGLHCPPLLWSCRGRGLRGLGVMSSFPRVGFFGT